MKFTDFENRLKDIKKVFTDCYFDAEELTAEQERKKGYYLSCMNDISKMIETFDYANSQIVAKGIPHLTADKRSIEVNGIRLSEGDTVEKELKDMSGNTELCPILIDDLLIQEQPIEQEIVIRANHDFTRTENKDKMCCDRCGKTFDILDYNGICISDVGYGSALDSDIDLQLCLDCTDAIILDILSYAEQAGK